MSAKASLKMRGNPVMPESSGQPVLRATLRVLYQVLAGFAGLSFLFGGRLLAEFAHMDRLMGEAIGIGVAVVCGVLAMTAKSGSEE
jgi:hypothetical protein